MPTEKAGYVIQHGAEGYTTNAPLEELMDDDVLIADEFVLELNGVSNGWQSIPTERGGPVRMIVPKLYAWKGSKFLIGMRFQQHDEPGFWETRGYHNHADPWRMERYG
jgi:DMSO/TMAO reductase YedYZ molybdopterin-dependent catalytic subunit